MAGAIERLRRQFVAKGLGCCAKASSFGITTPGPILPSRRMTHYGTTAGWATDQPSYNPDFTPCFCLLGHLKNNLADKRSSRDADMKQAVTSWQQTSDTDFFHAGIQALLARSDKCLNVNGDKVEVWCAPSATGYSY